MSDFTISKIEPQKKSKNRFSIFAGTEFIIGISADTLLKYGFRVGKKISSQLLEDIRGNEDYNNLKESAFRYLTRRPHSIKELKDKLYKKSQNKSAIQKIIEEFLQNKYLDDTAFANAFIEDEIRLKKSGPLLIKNKLLIKGVNIEIIKSAIENQYDESLIINNCETLANKKLDSLNKKFTYLEKKSKLANYLKQKGYYWSVVNNILENISIGETNEE